MQLNYYEHVFVILLIILAFSKMCIQFRICVVNIMAALRFQLVKVVLPNTFGNGSTASSRLTANNAKRHSASAVVSV